MSDKVVNGFHRSVRLGELYSNFSIVPLCINQSEDTRIRIAIDDVEYLSLWSPFWKGESVRFVAHDIQNMSFLFLCQL